MESQVLFCIILSVCVYPQPHNFVFFFHQSHLTINWSSQTALHCFVTPHTLFSDDVSKSNSVFKIQVLQSLLESIS